MPRLALNRGLGVPIRAILHTLITAWAPVGFLALGALGTEAAAGEPAAFASAQLPHQTGLLERWDPQRSYGSWLLVHTLTAVSERLAWELPHADPLMVGDISRRGGGRMHGHKTHDKGVDADIGLYMRGARTRP